MYYPIPPIELLKRHTRELEDRLNKLANLSLSKEEKKKYSLVKIKIFERTGQA